MALPSAPAASSAAARRVMQGNRRRNTGPERRLRSVLHSLGMRFRVDATVATPDLRVRPDVVFTRWKVAVFVDGCFWHGCSEHGTRPRTNPDYWSAKIGRNIERDRRVNAALRSAGWLVLRFWEHDDPALAALEVKQAVRTQQARRPSS